MSAITPQLQEQRKAALLNAALREFAEYGYEQASTNRIAKEAAAVLFDRDIALCCLTKNKGGIAILFLLIDYDFYDIPLLSE